MPRKSRNKPVQPDQPLPSSPLDADLQPATATFQTWLTDPGNRGLILDIIVLMLSLIMMRLLGSISSDFVNRAYTNDVAKLAVGLFFLGTFFMMPVGPYLARWSFHQRFSFAKGSNAGCAIIPVLIAAVFTMQIISGAGIIMTTETLFENDSIVSELGPLFIVLSTALAIFNAVIMGRYFIKPKAPPRWKFLMSPQAALAGNIFIFLSMINLQIIWNYVTAAPGFWKDLTETTHNGSYMGRVTFQFFVVGALAMLVYFPGRIFYLVEDRNRKIMFLTMFIANLPVIIRTMFIIRVW